VRVPTWIPVEGLGSLDWALRTRSLGAAASVCLDTGYRQCLSLAKDETVCCL
jgi:hypothetical protein